MSAESAVRYELDGLRVPETSVDGQLALKLAEQVDGSLGVPTAARELGAVMARIRASSAPAEPSKSDELRQRLAARIASNPEDYRNR